MASNVLVTLADERFLDQAKQVFSCIHLRSRWSGDYLLLAHDVPDEQLEPFRERGILVEPCKGWVVEKGSHFHPPTVLSKFELFTPRFRAWEHVVFADGDTMFWGSLEGLARRRGFGAISERRPLTNQFEAPSEQNAALHAELAQRVDLQQPTFNSGFMAFRTDVIREDSLQHLRDLYLRYAPIQFHRYSDQPALNLYFREWRALPDIYAAIRARAERRFGLAYDELPVVGRHFAGNPRPWNPGHPSYDEWRDNLARFEALDARAPRLRNRPGTELCIRARWTRLEVRRRLSKSIAPTRRRLQQSAPAKRLRWLLGKLRPDG
jgi:lipopolysaccharide biosynthesis glycosyltransferase